MRTFGNALPPQHHRGGEPGEKPYLPLGGQHALRDIIGDYSFDAPYRGISCVFRYGDLLHGQEQHVQRHAPADIVLKKKDGSMELVRQFGYEDFSAGCRKISTTEIPKTKWKCFHLTRAIVPHTMAPFYAADNGYYWR
jgi:hypothetical protein